MRLTVSFYYQSHDPNGWQGRTYPGYFDNSVEVFST